MNKKIASLVKTAINLEFETCPQFYDLSNSQLDNIYNGCGPDWLPENVRDLLTKYYEYFEAAFLEHDVSFEFSDSTEQGFNEANQRLYTNCKKLASRVTWWRPIWKLRRYRQAYIIYRACQDFGWSAWTE
jgi:hypothetical protein